MTRPSPKLDEFAELLSRDIEIHAIAERMGITRRAANSMLLRIRKRLGPQAV
jgi:hypothetical protein